MSKFLPFVTLLVVAATMLLLSACGSSNSGKYFPVKNRDPRVSSLGFSITPPSGKNWYERLNDKSLYYLKITEANNYSLFVQATEIEIDQKFSVDKEFLQYVKQKKQVSSPDKRYKNQRSKYTLQNSPSPYCVSYQQKWEDHGVKELGRNRYVQVNNRGLLCMHPDIPEVGIDVHYLEKSVSGRKTPSFQAEGEQILASVIFF